MLSRVADNLYWMSRYLERAEHTARLLDVNIHGVLDQSAGAAEARWERLLSSLAMPLDPKMTSRSRTIIQALTFDRSNPASIVSCVTSARDNARQAWEQISTEMWEQLNRLFLYVSRSTPHEMFHGEPHAFFTAIKQGAHLFQGITDSTMSHGEGWQFIQVGRGIERIPATTRLLDTHFCGGDDGEEAAPLDYLEWIGLLKSCSGFEAYVKIFSATVEPQTVAAFLLLNSEFPRSVRFVSAGVRAGLQSVARATGGRGAGRPERLAGRLLAMLEYSQIDEIMAAGFHDYLDAVEFQCNQIHLAITGSYIRYPVAPALAARER